MSENEDLVLLPELLTFEVYPFLPANVEKSLKGNNQKQTLILLGEKSQKDETQAFLSKIMAAVKFDLWEDTLIYNFSQDAPIPFADICQKYPLKQILFFDVPFKDIGLYIEIPKYRVIKWNSYKVLSLDSLSKIESNTALKRGLWTGLQQMFPQ